jgi:pyrimidine-specific ribonucleoside hydrolase
MLTLLLTLLAVAPTTQPVEPIDVWLDVDTSTGVVKNGRQADVDDGLAMIYAFHSPELKVHGVSVQFGNASLEQAVPIAEQIVEDFGPEGLQVYPGAASADQHDDVTEATTALAAALREQPMHILAVGPVTNVAAVLTQHPELAGRMRSIIVVAARRPGFRFGPTQAPEFFFPDANFEKDVAGMQILLDSGVPIVFAGYEVSSHLWLTPQDLTRMAAASEVGAYVSRTSAPWMGQWLIGLGTPGFNPFDTLADLWLTHPELIESIPVTLEITEDVDERATPAEQAAGATKHYLIATPTDEPTKYLYLTNPKEAAHEVIVSRLIAEGGSDE